MSVTSKNGIEGKECARCHIWKPLSAFYFDSTKGKSQGFRHCQCKACHAAVRTEQGAMFRTLKDRAVKLGVWDSIDDRAKVDAKRRLGIVDENLRL
jgi:hypothetical protein